MDKIKEFIKSLTIEKIAQGATIILGIGLLVSFASWLSKSGSLILQFLAGYLSELWGLTITLFILMTFLMVIRLQRRFSIGYKDKFKGDLDSNWDYEGSWTRPDKGVLCVTDSHIGGITKVGSLWENYIFEFDTRIMNDCSSWIIRAKDLDNYYMFQCREDVIRPHRQFSGIKIETKTENGAIRMVTKVEIGWEILDGIPHRKELRDWFHVRIEVRGESVWIYIDGSLVLDKQSYIKNSTGKVGFRNSAHEKALFKNVKVTLIE